MRFSLVVPCFNESESINLLLETLKPFLISKFADSWEIIFVDDGSLDSTRDVIMKAREADLRIKGLYLSRNFGHQPAIFSGLVYAAGDYVGVMDADMQDPPKVLLECFEKACEKKLDIVYAVRKSRQSSLTLKFCYWCFYRLMRFLSSHPWPLDAGDFSVMSRRAVSLVIDLPEHVRVLRGLRSWIGLRQGFVEYDRPERARANHYFSLERLESRLQKAYADLEPRNS